MKIDFFIVPLPGYMSGVHGTMEDVVSLSTAIFPCRDSRTALESKKLDPKFVAYMAGKNGTNFPVGFIIWRIEKDDVLLYRIGVKENYRHKGIGTALFLYSVSKLPCYHSGCKIIVHCSINNTAREFYEKIGFKISKTVEKYYSNGESAYEFFYDTSKK